MLRQFDASEYLLPYRRGRVRYPVSLTISDHTYGPGYDPARSWIPIALRSFGRIARDIPVRDLLIVGTGSGLDALGALEIFDLKSLLVTDLFYENVAVAQKNVLEHLEANVDVEFVCSDLFENIPGGRRFCLIYENLPNIPSSGGIQLEHGINAASFYSPRLNMVPLRFESCRLSLHYLCLRASYPRVRRGGGVLTSIGGRLPLEIAFDLHRSCGYAPELVVFDAKIQSEPDSMLPAYSAAEEETGLTFVFYALEALPLIAAWRKAGFEGLALAEAVRTELVGFAMTARDALRRWRRGQPVAHTVFFILGRQESGDER
jgi:hypothetical protein